jgi:UDP-3-O-[3-hydroxymyristoyl] glucosamine N-acyltransferase
MPDARFFHRAGPFSLGTLAALIGTEPLWPDDAAILIEDIAPLEAAGAHDISVFSDARHAQALQSTRAGVIITSPELSWRVNGRGARLLFARDPRLAYAQVGQLFYPAIAINGWHRQTVGLPHLFKPNCANARE